MIQTGEYSSDTEIDILFYRSIFQGGEDYPLRRDDQDRRRVHHNIDPWNRQAWRGSLLLDKVGNVHVVVTRAPSRVRTDRTKEDIVT